MNGQKIIVGSRLLLFPIIATISRATDRSILGHNPAILRICKIQAMNGVGVVYP
jgi:hypothetical protein